MTVERINDEANQFRLGDSTADSARAHDNPVDRDAAARDRGVVRDQLRWFRAGGLSPLAY